VFWALGILTSRLRGELPPGAIAARPTSLARISQSMTAFPPKRRAIGLAVAVLLASAGAAGAEPPRVGAQVRAEQTLLPNGLLVVSAQRPDAETAAIALVARAGARFESDETAGSAKFLERMYLQGTPRRPSRDAVLRTVTARGGTLSVGTGWEFFDFATLTAPEDFEVALDLLSDIIQNSTFDPERLEHQRGLILHELAERRDNPTVRAFDLFNETVFRDHELRFPPSGTPETVARLSREALLSYRERRLVASNLVAGVVSPFDHAEVVRLVGATLGGLPTAPAPSADGAPPPPASAQSVALAAGRNQATVIMGGPTPGLNHPDRYPLWVLQTILGPGGGRLFYDIRDVHGLAYDTSMRLALTAETGSILAYAGTDPNTVGLVTDLLREHLARARDELVSEAELESAIGFLVGGTVVGLESGSSYAGMLAHNTALGLPLTTAELEARLRAVSREDVRRVAQLYLAPERLTYVVVAPEA
jgi:predicted Zn-dependent peptidase